jgi:predicted RNA-binding Zn-ribbon protein involved in translation (DUF1610 family)
MSQYVDRVHCNNCGKDLHVEQAAEECPKCGEEGALAWREDGPNEVPEGGVIE